MMASSSAATSLLNEAAATSNPPAGTTLYLFGSSSHGFEPANDIDVLVVYPDGHLDEAHLLAESIRNMSAQYFFDVLALSASEERELAFVQGEHADRIWPSSS
jgi:Nucleotidyltransferase domain